MIFSGTIRELRAEVLEVLRANADLADLVSDEPPEVMGAEPDTRMGSRVYVGVSAVVVRILGRRRDADDPTLGAPTLSIQSWVRRQPDKIRASGEAHSYDVALDRAALLLSLLAAPSLSLDTLTSTVVVLDGWYRVEIVATGSQAHLTAPS
jgi:hypothetical protein